MLVEKDHEWASRKPSKRALQLAFYRGVLTVSRREGMLKTYELIDPPFRLGPAAAGRARSARSSNYLLDRALRAQGVVSLDSICHLDAPRKAAIAQADRRARAPQGAGAGRARGRGKLEHWARPRRSKPRSTPVDDIVHILNPFDPLIIQRKRLALFFGYEHRFEAYVPKEKRVFGYFAQPVLVGDEIVAVLDLKTDRERQKLLMQKWTWIAKAPAPRCASGRSRKRCTASSAFSWPADVQRRFRGPSG